VQGGVVGSELRGGAQLRKSVGEAILLRVGDGELLVRVRRSGPGAECGLKLRSGSSGIAGIELSTPRL